MKRLVSIRIDEDLLEEIDQFSKNRSEFINLLIHEFIENEKETISKSRVTRHAKRNKRLELNLTESEYETIKTISKLDKVSMSETVRFRFNSTLNNDPDLLDFELNELRKLISSLTRVGANINVIARHANSGIIGEIRGEDALRIYDDLRERIIDCKDLILELDKKARRRFEYKKD